jgi:heat shock protein 1/8
MRRNSFDAVKAFQAPLQAAPLVSKNGQPAFEVQIQGKKTVLTASEIVTKFLKTLYGFATDFLGRKPDHAVFAVPAYFDEAQKSALKDASKAAGVEISQLISAEGAAALAYGLTTSPSNSSFAIGDRNVLFLDVGGSSTTASLVAVRSGLLAPLASVRDDKLGGDDIDAKLVDYMSKEFIKKNKALKWDPSNHRAVAKLFLEAEVTKRSLSASTSATCAVESLMDGVDFSTTINRTRFDLLCGSIYQSIVDKALEAIEKAGLDPVQVHEVR